MLGVLLLVMSLLALLFALPIWALVDSFTSPRRYKRLWCALIVLRWPLGALLYGIVATKRRSLRTTARACS